MSDKHDDGVWRITERDPRFRDIGLTESEAGVVLGVCHKFCSYRDHMDDLVQAAVLALLQAFQRVERKGEPIRNRIPFIYKVVVNCMKTHFVQPSQKDLIFYCLNPFTPLGDWATWDMVLPEVDLDALASAVVVQGAVDGLDPKTRDILLSDVIDEVPQEEIAERYGIGQCTISRISKSARDSLREDLAPVLFPGEAPPDPDPDPTA